MSVTMNHTGIVVTDIDKAVEFYCEGIGLEVRFQVEAGGAELSQLLGYDDVQVKAAFIGGIDGHSVEIIEYLSPKTQRKARRHHSLNPPFHLPCSSLHPKTLAQQVRQIATRKK